VTLPSGIVEMELLDGLTRIASLAAAAILAVRSPADTRRDKSDRSPVTAADEAAESVIQDGLARLLPDVPVLSEEAAARPSSLAPNGRCLLVDPLDGTRELLAGDSEYAVNIALIDNGLPVMGVIAAPALNRVWRGIVGRGAERLALAPGDGPERAKERLHIRTRPQPRHGAVAVVSRFHRDAATDAYLDSFPDVQRTVVGASIKFCRIAEGVADIYARMAAMWPWDIAAGHALVTAAGGVMKAADGGTLRYDGLGNRLPPFVAFGDPHAARWR
jgi:3'(2'), 5'-bisphosphate nucleotidase